MQLVRNYEKYLRDFSKRELNIEGVSSKTMWAWRSRPHCRGSPALLKRTKQPSPTLIVFISHNFSPLRVPPFLLRVDSILTTAENLFCHNFLPFSLSQSFLIKSFSTHVNLKTSSSLEVNTTSVTLRSLEEQRFFNNPPKPGKSKLASHQLNIHPTAVSHSDLLIKHILSEGSLQLLHA